MKRIILIGAACALFAGCAQTTATTTGEEAKAYLDLMLENFFPDAKVNENGVYILSDQPGNGLPWTDVLPYTCAVTTIKSLGGTITSTSDEALAKQLGTYVQGNYYGPKYSLTGEGSSLAGVDAMLTGMKDGGTRTAIIPAWLLTTSRLENTQAYLNACTSTTPLIYTIKLYGQCEDIVQEQIDSLRRYVTRHYGADVQPVRFPGSSEYEGQFYFISDTTAFKDVPQRSEDETALHLNYTGRLLNGQVFDTTVEKAAKDAGIYSASKTYEGQSVTFSETMGDIKMGSTSDLIKGFQAGLYKMHWAGQKAVVLFTSPLGYDTSGSGNKVPGYSPLLFELEIY